MGVIVKYKIYLPITMLQGIYGDCDKYPNIETGGRLVGNVSINRQSTDIIFRHLIDAGEKAKRSRTSLFQDNEYQLKKFNELTKKDSTLNHIGSWHSHHCNGCPTLSSGDIETYQRTVNHENHNLNLFVALLVVKGKGEQKYDFKVFIFKRSCPEFIEIKKSDIYFQNYTPTIIKDDKDFQRDKITMSSLFPSIKPYTHKKLIYWKGEFKFGKSRVQVVVYKNRPDGFWKLQATNYKRCVENSRKVNTNSASKLLFMFYCNVLKFRKKALPKRKKRVNKRR